MTTRSLTGVLKKYFIVYALFILVFLLIRGFKLPGQAAWPWLILAFLLNVAFVIFKSAVLYLVACEIRPHISFVLISRAFLKSVTASVATFSGKIGFLTALFANMGVHLSKRESAKVLALYTGTNLSIFLSFLPFLLPLAPRQQFLGMILGAGAVICLLMLIGRNIRLGLTGLCVFFAYLTNYAQIAVIARSLGASWEVVLFRAVIAADVARIVSHVPLGLGVFDGVFYVLSKRSGILPALQLPAFFILVRCFGELLTAFWGLVILVLEEAVRHRPVATGKVAGIARKV